MAMARCPVEVGLVSAAAVGVSGAGLSPGSESNSELSSEPELCSGFSGSAVVNLLDVARKGLRAVIIPVLVALSPAGALVASDLVFRNVDIVIPMYIVYERFVDRYSNTIDR